MSSYQYRKSHCGDKTVVRSSYLHNGISYTGKMSSLYWIGALTTSGARGRLNIKMSSYQYRKSHCGDKMVIRSSSPKRKCQDYHNGISGTGKMISLYWIRALDFCNNLIYLLCVALSAPCIVRVNEEFCMRLSVFIMMMNFHENSFQIRKDKTVTRPSYL